MPAKATTRRTPAKKPTFNIVRTFQEWWAIKDQGTQLTSRQETLRDRMKDFIKEHGEKDEKGNFWVSLPEPMTFTDYTGKVFKYAFLKAQRALVPAVPQPNPEKAEALLRKKKLWLTPDEEKVLNTLARKYRYLNINVNILADGVTGLVFTDDITDKEYESILGTQDERFSFIPAES